jgi:hypothetical protein
MRWVAFIILVLMIFGIGSAGEDEQWTGLSWPGAIVLATIFLSLAIIATFARPGDDDL